ncbi:hypothetical protein ACFW1I_35730, partial [Streptomyces sp. NPDC058955]
SRPPPSSRAPPSPRAAISSRCGPHRAPGAAHDRAGRVDALAAAHGLAPAGTTTFTGHGQGATPESTARRLRAGYYASWFHGDPATTDTLATALAALPDQHGPRPAPEYRLTAYAKPGAR